MQPVGMLPCKIWAPQKDLGCWKRKMLNLPKKFIAVSSKMPLQFFPPICPLPHSYLLTQIEWYPATFCTYNLRHYGCSMADLTSTPISLLALSFRGIVGIGVRESQVGWMDKVIALSVKFLKKLSNGIVGFKGENWGKAKG